MSADFTALLIEHLETTGGVGEFAAACREAGRKSAARLQHDLGLGSDFEDAELAWRLVSKFSGMKFSVERSAQKSLFVHHVCPALSAGGTKMCESFCIPFVEGLTEAMCPSCGMAVCREATGERPCAKALLRGGGRDAGKSS